jgi:serine/threonine-protein kinase
VAPGVPDPVAAAVMRGLATEPADRFETADAFGVALAEAATQAWGPGWLAAEQVPIMDAGPMIGAAGHPSGARPAAAAAGPTLSPAGLSLAAAGPTLSAAAPATESARRADALSQAPTQGGEGIAVAPGTETAIPARSPETRRRVIIAAVVVAVILVVILAVFLLPKMFTTYRSSADLHPPPATAQLR